MDEIIKASLEKFINAFEAVFDKDWAYTKGMLGVRDETKEQPQNSDISGLEIIHIISPDGTFLNPRVDDEVEDWGLCLQAAKKMALSSAHKY